MSLTPFYIVFSVIGLLVAAHFALETLKFILTHTRSGSLHRYNHHQTQNSWALVTGATSGIGAELASELCRRGFNVIVHGRSPTKLENIKAKLTEEFPNSKVKITVADALDRANASVAIEQVVADVGDLPLTVLINNIGGLNGIVKPQFKSFSAHSPQEITATLDLNVRFSFQLTHALLPLLQTHSPSLILSIGSNVATIKMPYLAVYAAAKACLVAWSANLGAEIRLAGPDVDVEVLAVLVGNTATPGRLGIPSGVWVPTARVLAGAALRRVGCGRDAVAGYFPHALQLLGLRLLPGWVAAYFIGVEATRLRDTDPEAT